MPFEKISQPRLAQAAVDQIEQLILRGILRPGDRLPSERDLAHQLGLSRPSLREALGQLQSDGLLVSKVGSGVFVAEVLGSAFSSALVGLMAKHRNAIIDYISFRRDLESIAVARAATQASATDLSVIQAAFQCMEDAAEQDDPATEAARDADFHMAIIEASHNIVMLHMMRSMFDLLQQGVFYNRQIMFARHTTRAALLDQHRAINAALQARDADKATAAVTAHLDFVEDCLITEGKIAENEATSQLRLQRVQT